MNTYMNRQEALRALLADGQWHDRGEIELHLAPYIDGQAAARNYITNFNTVRKKRGLPEDGAERSDEHFEEAFIRGRWRIIQQAISSLGGCERRGDRGSPEYRWTQANRTQGALTLSPSEEGLSEPGRSLAELERIIERGARAFVEVGLALLEIKTNKLYRGPGHGTFEEYLEKRWRMQRQTGYDYIHSFQVVENVRALVQTLPSINQATILARLKPEGQREVAQSVDFAEITTRQLAERVKGYRKNGSRALTLVEVRADEPRVSVVATAEGFIDAIRRHLTPGQIAEVVRGLTQAEAYA
jgi:hypothetical protein